jgi:BirA family biotin operon repressor/biotin-[acetyl-CoA-carboxylase] ligase
VFSEEMHASLSEIGIREIMFFGSTGSTNQDAIVWFNRGAGHCSLVVADEQTNGRGRKSNRWYTKAGTSIAFSLILCEPDLSQQSLGVRSSVEENILRLTAAGTLAVCAALEKDYSLPAKVKWPNDVIVAEKKIAGVLAELQWSGNQLQGAVIGIGVNVTPDSVPPAHLLNVPAGSLETLAGKDIDRARLLSEILRELLSILQVLDDDSFIKTWQDKLLYLNREVVLVWKDELDGAERERVTLIGLSSRGLLRVKNHTGDIRELPPSGFHLRPIRS